MNIQQEKEASCKMTTFWLLKANTNGSRGLVSTYFPALSCLNMKWAKQGGGSYEQCRKLSRIVLPAVDTLGCVSFNWMVDDLTKVL